MNTNSKTKGQRVEGIATVTYIGQWMSRNAYFPCVDFEVNGVVSTWNADMDYMVSGLQVGAQVQLCAFRRSNGNLYKVSWKHVS